MWRHLASLILPLASSHLEGGKEDGDGARAPGGLGEEEEEEGRQHRRSRHHLGLADINNQKSKLSKFPIISVKSLGGTWKMVAQWGREWATATARARPVGQANCIPMDRTTFHLPGGSGGSAC